MEKRITDSPEKQATESRQKQATESRQKQATESRQKEELIDLLIKNKTSPIANTVANMVGLQVVNRSGKVYVRKIPERLTGSALNSAIAFGEINHNNRNGTGVILLPDGIEQNIVAFNSAREFAGTKFVKPLTEKEKIKKLVEQAEQKEHENQTETL